MFMTIRSATVPVLSLLFAVAAAAQQTPMRPGRWEITMQMEMANVPMKMPPMTVSECITAEQLKKDPTSGLPSGAPKGSPNDCKVSDYKQSGDTVSWKMACTNPQAMTGDGELTFKADAYTGTVKMTSPQGPMSMKMDGKRLGDCAP
jgi:hypothetical protein